MFENFVIPKTPEECSEHYYTLSDIWTILRDSTPKNSIGGNRWTPATNLTEIAGIIQCIFAVDLPEDKKISFRATTKRVHTMTDMIQRGRSEKTFNLLINEEESTHYDESTLPGAKHLHAAENALKQTPQHFLKLFTVNEQNTLYVYTNKPLTPVTIYKIMQLAVSLYTIPGARETKYAARFIDALVKDDTEKAITILNEVMESDIVKEYAFKNFSQILDNPTENRINHLMSEVAALRGSIARYENSIAENARNIREYNEQILFLRSQKADDEEYRLYYKYLKKHPYIESFKISSDETLTFYYKAPITYFSTLPAEKMIAHAELNSTRQQIIKMIIGGKYELWTKCKIVFNTKSFQTSTEQIYDNIPLLRHPHLDKYNCFGNNRQAIAESAEAGDYIGATEQISQAVLNLNFYDTCVVDWMISELSNKYSTLRTWRYKETGEYFTTKEVYERGDYYEETETDTGREE